MNADSDVSRDMPRTAPHKALAIAMEAEKPHYYQVPQDEHGWDMWASRVELSLMGRGLAIEAEASAEPGALREALDWRELAEILALPTVRRKLEARAFGHAAIAICAALSREEATSER